MPTLYCPQCDIEFPQGDGCLCDNCKREFCEDCYMIPEKELYNDEEVVVANVCQICYD